MTSNELRQILADALDSAADRLRAGIEESPEREAAPTRPALSEPLADVTNTVLSAEEVAQLLGHSRGSVYEALRTGEIPSLRVGHRLLVPPHALRAWLMGPFG